ncbi:MAG: response regulator [Halobellus sp.]|uniref:response regulator n=1 Tax=Halobellus sp. TaxID=1979212 RepID=UPI0035D5161A
MTFHRLQRGGSSRSPVEPQDIADETSGDADVLVVENNPGDVRLLEEAFTDLDADVLCLRESRKMPGLLAQIRRGEVSSPALVLSDLNMPKIDGFDILAQIKSSDELRAIPVVIFSGSTLKKDIARAYELGANAYVSKPADVDEYLLTLEALSDFWLQ